MTINWTSALQSNLDIISIYKLRSALKPPQMYCRIRGLNSNYSVKVANLVEMVEELALPSNDVELEDAEEDEDNGDLVRSIV